MTYIVSDGALIPLNSTQTKLNTRTIAEMHLCHSDVDENRAGCSYIDEEKKLNDTATVTSADTAVTQLTVTHANISM